MKDMNRTCAASMPEMSMVGMLDAFRRSTKSVTSEGERMPSPHRMWASFPAENLLLNKIQIIFASFFSILCAAVLNAFITHEYSLCPEMFLCHACR